jgi:hypothetical protein
VTQPPVVVSIEHADQLLALQHDRYRRLSTWAAALTGLGLAAITLIAASHQDAPVRHSLLVALGLTAVTGLVANIDTGRLRWAPDAGELQTLARCSSVDMEARILHSKQSAFQVNAKYLRKVQPVCGCQALMAITALVLGLVFVT